MLTLLIDDITMYITTFLSFNDIINITSTCKMYYYNIFTDDYFYNLAVSYYSENFWKISNMRSKDLSKPLKNYKLELLRIEKFQQMIVKYNAKRWTINDFYSYWNYQETLKNNNKYIINKVIINYYK